MKTTITFLILFSIRLMAGIGIGYSDSGALPVELTSFTAKQSASSVELRWATATEINNYGFEIQKSVINKLDKLNNNDSNWPLDCRSWNYHVHCKGENEKYPLSGRS